MSFGFYLLFHLYAEKRAAQRSEGKRLIVDLHFTPYQLVYSVSHIAKIIGARARIISDTGIEHLLFDSRKVFFPAASVFFALKGARRDGHQFVAELYQKGVRSFVVSEHLSQDDFPEANILKVTDSFAALRELTAFHRRQFSYPVIGITGSNGKTMVKEWLYQLLHESFNIVRSPKSYNSQLGAPLSVWQMQPHHALGIFEAGISQPGEMENLNRIIQPTIGILTNIGEAHSEGFENADQKTKEKLKLFNGANLVIYGSDDWMADKAIVLKHEIGFHKTGRYPFRIFSWGRMNKADLQMAGVLKKNTETAIFARYKNSEVSITIPFTDDASIQNAISCWCVMLHLQLPYNIIAARMKRLQPVNMRLELKKGINHSTIINDSYSADLSSLHIALNFLQHKAGSSKKTVILSDFFQTGMSDEELYRQIAEELSYQQVDRVIGIGMQIKQHLKFDAGFIQKKPQTEFYSSTGDFISHFRFTDFRDEAILVKGARVFQFEQISQLLEQKTHQTELEINLNAVAHNLKQYQQHLQPHTKLMVMVKAFAYGSGGAEIANTIQFHKADYLGVAYADEGVELRKAGISLPIMVMNSEREAFDTMITHQLEPVLFSMNMLHELDTYLKQEGIKNYPVHVETETGMNRLGFAKDDITKFASALRASGSVRVQSVFSHLAASEKADQDDFTQQQFKLFTDTCDVLQKELNYPFIRHIANSAAIIRHPQMQLDMVRLGIGLYGIDGAASGKTDLIPVASLKSTIAQIKKLKAGESVSYGRTTILEKDAVIATVSIGYADGYSRRLGNGNGKMLVKGQLAPVCGAVCMDMTMIDITGIEGVKEGDEVIIFGKDLPVQDLAIWAGTIPYEIMTGISQRVKRIYFEV